MELSDFQGEPTAATREQAQDLLGPTVEEYFDLIEEAGEWEDRIERLQLAISRVAGRLTELDYLIPREEARIRLLAALAGREDVVRALPEPPEDYPDRETVCSHAVQAVQRATQYSGVPHFHATDTEALETILDAFGPRVGERAYLHREWAIDKALDRLRDDEEAEAIRALVEPTVERLLEEERRQGRTGVPDETETPAETG